MLYIFFISSLTCNYIYICLSFFAFSDNVFHCIMDRRLNILVFVAIFFFFCQARVHTTSTSQCKRYYTRHNVKTIDPSFPLPKSHKCIVQVPYCAGVCHSVDQFLMKDGNPLTKCECCQPIVAPEMKKVNVFCFRRLLNGKFQIYKSNKKATVADIKACVCTTCRSKAT